MVRYTKDVIYKKDDTSMIQIDVQDENSKDLPSIFVIFSLQDSFLVAFIKKKIKKSST